MSDEKHPERAQRRARLADLAARQWGNVTTRQLAMLGFSRREIAGMAERGELLRAHRGVYALGHRSPAPEAQWAAALLAAGPPSALSHTAAAAARGLMVARGVTEVTTPADRRGDARLRGSGLISLDDLLAFSAAADGLPGVASLRAALDVPHTRSRGERRLAAFLTRQGFDFEMNARVGRLHVDALIPGLGVAIELDPEQTHGTAHARRTDSWRDRYLRGRCLEPLRIEISDLDTLAAELRARA